VAAHSGRRDALAGGENGAFARWAGLDGRNSAGGEKANKSRLILRICWGNKPF
jgi:hypothetical protein